MVFSHNAFGDFVKVALFTLSFFIMGQPAGGQEPPGSADPESVEEEADPLRVDESTGGELFQAVRERIAEGEIRDAAALIETALAETSDESELEDVFQSRRLVASAFLRINNPRDAYDQVRKLVKLQAETIDEAVSREHIVVALAALVQLSGRIKRTEEARATLDEAITALESAAASGDSLETREELANARIVKSRLLAAMKETDASRQILQSEFDELRDLRESQPDSELALAMYLRATANLMTQTTDKEERSKLYDQHQEILRERLAEQPENLSYAVQFLNVARFRLREELLTDPDLSQSIIDDARQVARQVVEADPSSLQALEGQLAGLEQVEQIVKGQKLIRELIGTEAKPLEAVAWVNGEPVSDEDRAGSVVLLDFWAAWSPPSIAAMQKYRELSEKYADKGLKIVGVTRYFNIEWDFDARSPRRGSEQVTPEAENEALALFLEKQQVTWPSMVIANADALFDDYALTGLPHSVLIDREGKIQMINVGASTETLARLEEKIRELLGLKDE